MSKPLESRQVLKLGSQVVKEGDGDRRPRPPVLPLLPPAVQRPEPAPRAAAAAARPRLLFALAPPRVALVGFGTAGNVVGLPAGWFGGEM